MKILLTGANSQLARRVIPLIDKELETVTLGRNPNDIPWTLGIRPDPSQIIQNGIEACIHFAWSTTDREQDSHINVGGTAQLSAFCKELKIPFLFVSSLASQSESAYGKSKLRAEKYVIENNGAIIRPGLVVGSNKYVESKKRFIQVIPKSDVAWVPINTALEVSAAINLWLGDLSNIGKYKELELPKQSVKIQELFPLEAKYSLPLRLPLIDFTLRILSPFNLKARNYLDSLKSLKIR